MGQMLYYRTVQARTKLNWNDSINMNMADILTTEEENGKKSSEISTVPNLFEK